MYSLNLAFSRAFLSYMRHQKHCNPGKSDICSTVYSVQCLYTTTKFMFLIIERTQTKTYIVAASISRRGGLRSSTTSNLVIQGCRLSTYSTRVFNVASSACWNGLPDYL